MADGQKHDYEYSDGEHAGRLALGFFRTGVRGLLRQAYAFVGLILILIAIPIGFITPLLPVGLPIAIVGVVLLGRNSLWGKRWMERILARHPRIERLAPNWLMVAVFGREKHSPHDLDPT